MDEVKKKKTKFGSKANSGRTGAKTQESQSGPFKISYLLYQSKTITK